ncbi:MAG: hypothetical protein LLG97_02250 [Deltaproteobacteria bacterium]|nr:hypothetical protein [Deltaproteobacteria bacterium]
MRKKMFGKLLTVSLSEKLYRLVEEISKAYGISMGEVVRGSIDYAMNYDGCWMASKPKPFTSSDERVPIDFSDYKEITAEDLDVDQETEGGME